MLQELYSETGAAAQAIVEEVAPAVNETTKEEIAGAAVDRAEAIADNIADTVKLEQSEHAAIVEACAQVIYAETLAELADNAKVNALESLFTEEYVQETYAALEAEQEQYAGEGTFSKIGKHLNDNSRAYGAAAGTAAGAGIGYVAARRAAKKSGLQPGTPEYKKFIAKYMAGGAVAGAATSELIHAGIRTHKLNKLGVNKWGDPDTGGNMTKNSLLKQSTKNFGKAVGGMYSFKKK